MNPLNIPQEHKDFLPRTASLLEENSGDKEQAAFAAATILVVAGLSLPPVHRKAVISAMALLIRCLIPRRADLLAFKALVDSRFDALSKDAKERIAEKKSV